MGTAPRPGLPKIIGSVVCTPPTARVGESVLVEVKSPSGETYSESENLQILINGSHGARQYFQWQAPGAKKLFVAASRVGRPPEWSLAKVEIQAAEPGKKVPVLRFRRSLASPTRVEFSIMKRLSAAAGRARIPVKPAPARTAAAPRVKMTAQARRELRARQGLTSKADPVQELPAPVYRWDFGEGHIIEGPRSVAIYDFGPRLDPDRTWSLFEVCVTVKETGAEPIVLRRTVTVFNAYALAKKRGVIQPPATSDVNAVFWKGEFLANVTAFNPEHVPVGIFSYRMRPIFEAPERSSPLGPIHPFKMQIPARSAATIRLRIQQAEMPGDAIGFAVLFSGSGPSNKPLRLSAYFDIPGRRKHRKFASAELAKVLDKLAAHGLVSRRSSISVDELRGLCETSAVQAIARKVAPAMLPRLSPSQLGNLDADDSMQPRIGDSDSSHGKDSKPVPHGSADEPPGAIVEGGPCSPDNLPDNIPENFACQATGETVQEEMPARFMNARKGDLIVTAFADSVILPILRALEPSQIFTHSGIMTRNFDQITHSTASEQRILDYPNGDVLGEPAPLDGYLPNVLKYAWPGAITQTVEGAVNGEIRKDPENLKGYNITSFSVDYSWQDLGSPFETGYPLVIMPDPSNETIEVRQRLHQVANWAVHPDFGGEWPLRSHYRFFCYTDPRIGDTDRAPASSGWAAGSFPSVCSSFIWMAVKRSGALMEGDTLEPQDHQPPPGAERDATSPDGLYLYRADERLRAGEALYAFITDKARAEVPAAIDAVEDVVDDIGNQFCNAFASDWCDTPAKDSDAWRTTSEADAVSPDDLLRWDPPPQGLYGYWEPVVYRPRRWETVVVSRWRKVFDDGTLQGSVLLEGQPVEGVLVQLYDGMFTHTDAQGRFVLPPPGHKLPVGHYVLKANYVVQQTGEHFSADLPVQVLPDQTTTVVVDLRPPVDLFRQAEIHCYVRVTDHEWGSAGSDPVNETDEPHVVRVGPGQTHGEVSVAVTCDEEIIGEAFIAVDLGANKHITVTLVVRYYDGTDMSEDLECETVPFSMDLAPNQARGCWGRITAGDEVYVEMTAVNIMQQT